jgi:endonuclease/exonuclease/phosphatase family metal-dependent hydrolase
VLVGTATLLGSVGRGPAELAGGAERRAPAPGEALTMRASNGGAASDAVVVVTWNVHVGGGDVLGLVDDLRDGAFTGGSPVPAFAVLLQEAHRVGPDVLRPGSDHDGQTLHFAPPEGARVDVVESAARAGLHLAYAPAEANGREAPGAPEEDRGVAILSSHRLSDVRVIELPRERQRRVALVATMHGMGEDGVPWRLRVASAHLENRARWGRALDSFGAARARQARVLVEALGHEPVVLGGDLNTWAPRAFESALKVVERHFPGSPRVDGPTYRVLGIERTLDHLLFRLEGGQRASAAIVPDPYGSDHLPVVGVIELGAPRGEAGDPPA